MFLAAQSGDYVFNLCCAGGAVLGACALIAWMMRGGKGRK